MWGAIKSVVGGPIVSRVIGGVLGATAGWLAHKGISVDPAAIDALTTAVTMVVYGVSHKTLETVPAK